jgi:hypothetical protein
MPAKGNHPLVWNTYFTGSDNGLNFTAEVVQLVAKDLGITLGLTTPRVQRK